MTIKHPWDYVSTKAIISEESPAEFILQREKEGRRWNIVFACKISKEMAEELMPYGY